MTREVSKPTYETLMKTESKHTYIDTRTQMDNKPEFKKAKSYLPTALS